RHHGQVFLTREIRIEEFPARHAQTSRDELVHAADGVRYSGFRSVQIERCGRETALHLVSMSAKLEIELHLDGCARTRTEEAHSVPLATDRRLAVQRPGDRFEYRRLAGSVRSDDRRDTAIESHLRPRVLPEVLHAQAVDLHGESLAGIAAAAASAWPRYSMPSDTNAARSISAEIGRDSSLSRNISGSDGRLPGAPLALRSTSSGRR